MDDCVTRARTGSEPEPTAPSRTRRRARWMIRRDFSFVGLTTALVCFWISLTPSLLPRRSVAQGVLSGITVMIGYGIGTAGSALVRTQLRREPSARNKRIAWWALAVVAVAGSALMLWRATRWDEELRGRVGLEPYSPGGPITVVAVTILTASIILFGARTLRLVGRFLARQAGRFVPAPVAAGVGVALTALIVLGLVQGFLWRGVVAGMNNLSSVADGRTDEGAQQPSAPDRSGSEASLVEWDELGRMGRRFTGLGPSVPDLEAFHGPGCCDAPIRVYVGLESAGSSAARAQLAVDELERTGAFDRSVLAVYTATGTGWINPRAADGLEYLHRGDTAQVSMQYSYLPSWMSFLVDQTKAAEAGDDLIGAILERVEARPAAGRPRVLLYGESLGSYGTEQAFTGIDDLQASVDGALLVGPTFSNPIWVDLTEARVPGTPQWLPVVDRPGVRFARTPEDLHGVAGEGAPPVVYLQNSSDPITWWNTELAVRRPEWAEGPQPPDRASAFRWFPIVTFWQGAVDLVDSLGVPTGYGHNFGSNVVDAWVAILPPDDWTEADTARLKQLVYGDGDDDDGGG